MVVVPAPTNEADSMPHLDEENDRRYSSNPPDSLVLDVREWGIVNGEEENLEKYIPESFHGVAIHKVLHSPRASVRTKCGFAFLSFFIVFAQMWVYKAMEYSTSKPTCKRDADCEDKEYCGGSCRPITWCKTFPKLVNMTVLNAHKNETKFLCEELDIRLRARGLFLKNNDVADSVPLSMLNNCSIWNDLGMLLEFVPGYFKEYWNAWKCPHHKTDSLFPDRSDPPYGRFMIISCAKCFDHETWALRDEYDIKIKVDDESKTAISDKAALAVKSIRWRTDFFAILFCVFICAMIVRKETNDILLCEMMLRNIDADENRKCFDSSKCENLRKSLCPFDCCIDSYALLLLACLLRKFVVVGWFLPNLISQIIWYNGADALSVCLNVTAVLFVLDIDDTVYAQLCPIQVQETYIKECEKQLHRCTKPKPSLIQGIYRISRFVVPSPTPNQKSKYSLEPWTRDKSYVIIPANAESGQTCRSLPVWLSATVQIHNMYRLSIIHAVCFFVITIWHIFRPSHALMLAYEYACLAFIGGSDWAFYYSLSLDWLVYLLLTHPVFWASFVDMVNKHTSGWKEIAFSVLLVASLFYSCAIPVSLMINLFETLLSEYFGSTWYTVIEWWSIETFAMLSSTVISTAIFYIRTSSTGDTNTSLSLDPKAPSKGRWWFIAERTNLLFFSHMLTWVLSIPGWELLYVCSNGVFFNVYVGRIGFSLVDDIKYQSDRVYGWL